jgi:hypothetical protein
MVNVYHTSVGKICGATYVSEGLFMLRIPAAGVYELLHPPAEQVFLNRLHPNVWWCGILAMIGVVYCSYFAPDKGRV